VAGRLAQQLERPLQRPIRVAMSATSSGAASRIRIWLRMRVRIRGAACRFRELTVTLWRRAGAACGYWVGGSIGSGI
jgi:hypothetical protein